MALETKMEIHSQGCSTKAEKAEVLKDKERAAPKEALLLATLSIRRERTI